MFSLTIEAGGGYVGHVFFLLNYEDRGLYRSSNTLEALYDYGKENGLYIPIDKIKKIIGEDLKEQDNGCFLIDKDLIDKNAPISSANKYLKKINENLKITLADIHN